MSCQNAGSVRPRSARLCPRVQGFTTPHKQARLDFAVAKRRTSSDGPKLSYEWASSAIGSVPGVVGL
jgi:hypothetical protein